MNRSISKALSAVAALCLAALVWQLMALRLVRIGDPMAEKKVPPLSHIAEAFGQYGGSVLHQAGITLSYAAAGFLIGAAVGIGLALLMRLSGVVEKMALPYLLASQMIPILGLAPIVFGLFKDLAVSRMVIAAYITFFPVAVNLLSGLKSVEEELKEMMISYGAIRRQLYGKLLIPYALPWLFTGLKIAAPMAVTAAILVDTLSSQNGIGYIIIVALYGGGTVGQFWPAILTAAVMGVGSFFLITALEQLVLGRRKGRRRRSHG